jgi:hypothetical protein
MLVQMFRLEDIHGNHLEVGVKLVKPIFFGLP